MEEINGEGRTHFTVCSRNERYTMKHMKIFAALGIICLLLMCIACSQDPSYEDRETFPQETYVSVGNGSMILYDALTVEEMYTDSNVAEWLDACAGSDRDDYFGGYVLRHEATEGENTVYTYLVYYPHGGEAMTVLPQLVDGTSGCVLNLHYAKGSGTEGYALSMIRVILPSGGAPRVRLLVNDDTPGVIVSVSKEAIPVP